MAYNFETPFTSRGNLELLNEAFDERYRSICEIVLSQFDREVKLIFRLQVAFSFLVFLEIIAASCLFVWLGPSVPFALSLAALFLTTFASFTTLIYLSTARSTRLVDLRDRFIRSCAQHLNYEEGRLAHHLTLAEMASRQAMEMGEREYNYLKLSSLLLFLNPYLERISAWRHWKDVHNFRRMLLESVLDESLMLVRCDPLNIEVHANLANAYVLMASLFCDPRKAESLSTDEGDQPLRWFPQERLSPNMQELFRYFCALAVEEFKIISEFAPEDPWVHAQLAYSYHDLNMIEEESRSYQNLLELCPQDDDARFRLGLLYFQQGMNAQGLQTYSFLKEANYPKTHLLISFYGKQRERSHPYLNKF